MKKTTYDNVLFQRRVGSLTLTSSGLTFRSSSGDGPPLTYRIFWGLVKDLRLSNANDRAALMRLSIAPDEDDEGEDEEDVVLQLKEHQALLDLKQDIQARLRKHRGKNITTDTQTKAPEPPVTEPPKTEGNEGVFTRKAPAPLHDHSAASEPEAFAMMEHSGLNNSSNSHDSLDADAKRRLRLQAKQLDEEDRVAKQKARRQPYGSSSSSSPATAGANNMSTIRPITKSERETDLPATQENKGDQPSLPFASANTTSKTASTKSTAQAKVARRGKFPHEKFRAANRQNGQTSVTQSHASPATTAPPVSPTRRKKRKQSADRPGVVRVELSHPERVQPSPAGQDNQPASPLPLISREDEEAAIHPVVREPSTPMIVATLVTEDTRRDVREEEHEPKILVEAHQVQLTDLFCDRRMKVIALILILIIAVVIIVVSAMLSKPSSTGTPTEPDDMAQELASEWLKGHPELDELEDWRKQQLLALATMSFAINAPSSWLQESIPECEWIFPGSNNDLSPDCTDGRYQQLSLDYVSSPAEGTIPPEIGWLEKLKFVDLGNNRLSGPIPSEVGLLTSLQFLSLDFNALESTIPLDLFALVRIELLSLGKNQVTGTISSRIGALTALTELNLVQNRLTGSMPTELGRLTNLTSLDLSSNDLLGRIPSELGLLTSLTTLYLSGTFDGELPTELLNLKELTQDSRDNLDSITFVKPPTEAPSVSPPSSSNETAAPTTAAFTAFLQFLVANATSPAEAFADPMSPQYRAAFWLFYEDPYKDNNALDWADPKMLQRYAAATFYYATSGDSWKLCGANSPSCGDTQWLDAADECGWFSLSCEEAGSMVTEMNFPATGNDLIGEMPPEMSLFTALKRWLAPENLLKGDLDVAFGALTGLQSVAMPDNRLEGKMPTGILENNPNLQVLDLGGNQLDGPIPPAIASATKLTDLQLGGNLLTGTVPSEIGQLSLLMTLELQTNDLVGSIPDELFGLNKLTHVSIRENEGINGAISPLISQLTSLGILQLGFTGLKGPIPEQMFVLTDLYEMNLEGASFSGTIPESFRRLNASLMDLFLNDNVFTGAVPEAFDYLTALETLQIQGNQLTGSISQAVCAERGLRFQQLATLIVDCVVECSCCDNCEE